MANTIALAEKYLNDPENFNQIYKAEAATRLLEATRFKVLDANTVKLPNYKFTSNEIGDYNRETGTTPVGLIQAWDTYTLKQDKGETIYLDDMDNEETLSEGIIKRANERERTALIPYIDKYRFGVITKEPTATESGAHIVTGSASTTTDAIANVDSAVEYLQTNEVLQDGLVLYVTPAFRNTMQRSSDIVKVLGTRDLSVNGVNTKFDVYNDIVIETVPPSRLGEGVEFILIQPKSVSAFIKFNESHLINATTTTTNLFGYHWKYRLYHDIFISEGQSIVEGGLKVNPGIYVRKVV